MSKFYTYNQNNSGGYFVCDNKAGVAEYIIVEANNVEQANDIFRNIGKAVDGFWNYCECCGDRWDLFWENDEDEGKSEPMLYGTPLAKMEQDMFRHRAFVHYLDGTIKEYVFKQKENT